MTELSPEQQKRADLLHALREILMIARLYHPTMLDAVWLHFTDWHGRVDISELESAGLLFLDRDLKYQPVGDWRDQFPPDAYHLTLKGVWVNEHSSPWVYYGATTQDEWETANPAYFAQKREYERRFR